MPMYETIFMHDSEQMAEALESVDANEEDAGNEGDNTRSADRRIAQRLHKCKTQFSDLALAYSQLEDIDVLGAVVYTGVNRTADAPPIRQLKKRAPPVEWDTNVQDAPVPQKKKCAPAPPLDDSDDEASPVRPTKRNAKVTAPRNDKEGGNDGTAPPVSKTKQPRSDRLDDEHNAPPRKTLKTVAPADDLSDGDPASDDSDHEMSQAVVPPLQRPSQPPQQRHGWQPPRPAQRPNPPLRMGPASTPMVPPSGHRVARSTHQRTCMPAMTPMDAWAAYGPYAMQYPPPSAHYPYGTSAPVPHVPSGSHLAYGLT
ncbi:hypothetical protein BV22DRAFT_1135725 [Leucogyrophana mollusca]|uniref:Uncharacterized protein n=1 Tax=Leucogyrophana mollusca TaxID=85980 RepID=A0ACB8AXC0_9AGAM|nr:hypothetical protein BV22DRAFT_1135725 [Leucogyrophana mollusca]